MAQSDKPSSSLFKDIIKGGFGTNTAAFLRSLVKAPLESGDIREAGEVSGAEAVIKILEEGLPRDAFSDIVTDRGVVRVGTALNDVITALTFGTGGKDQRGNQGKVRALFPDLSARRTNLAIRRHLNVRHVDRLPATVSERDVIIERAIQKELVEEQAITSKQQEQFVAGQKFTEEERRRERGSRLTRLRAGRTGTRRSRRAVIPQALAEDETSLLGGKIQLAGK